MTCINQITKNDIIAKIEKLDAQISALYLQMDEAIELSTVESYTLDTGQGRQTTKHRNFMEIQKQISYLESRRAWLFNRLKGVGLLNINVSRRIRGNY